MVYISFFKNAMPLKHNDIILLWANTDIMQPYEG